jgi:outer membrane immunogenic protein
MRNSRFIVSAALALGAIVGIGAASAADLAARPYTKAPMLVDPGYNWTGFYVGGNIGYSWGRSSDTSTLATGAGTVLFTSISRSDLNGVVGGGQIGYNWQMKNWVWGLEADIQGSDQKGGRDFACPTGVCTPPSGFGIPVPGPAVPVSLNQKLDWFGTVRGRIGLLASPSILLYGTGGLAYGEVKTSGSVNAQNAFFASAFSASDTKVGYSVGAGVEGVIGGNWTAKLEYLYVDLGRVSGSFPTITLALGGGNLVGSYSSRITDNIVRAGVNYKFGGPVVARY